MPRKTKETIEENKKTKKVNTRKKASKTASSSKSTTKTVKKETSTKSKTATTRKKAVSKKTPEKVTLKTFSPEYYDLPYNYNKTVVKILAQTPSSLFIYWEISNDDRKAMQEKYGKHFFEITQPVLIIHNLTMNYSFDVVIDDFANGWYVKVNDSHCEYSVELGRRPRPINYDYIHLDEEEIENNVTYSDIKPIEQPYIYVSSSNQIESPNDRILFNYSDFNNTVKIRNIKNGNVVFKPISEFPFAKFKEFDKKAQQEFYKKLYPKEFENGSFIHNPSSNPGSSINK